MEPTSQNRDTHFVWRTRNLVVWESPRLKRCLLDYDPLLRLTEARYSDGSAIEIAYAGDTASGRETSFDGKTVARIELSKDLLDYRRLDPDSGRELKKPTPPGGTPDLSYFLKKAAENRKANKRGISPETVYKYDEKGRLTSVERPASDNTGEEGPEAAGDDAE